VNIIPQKILFLRIAIKRKTRTAKSLDQELKLSVLFCEVVSNFFSKLFPTYSKAATANCFGDKNERRMKQKLFYALVLVATTIFSSVHAQQTSKMSPGGTGFLQYLPDGYSSSTSKYPIVISLHGIKEKGNTLTDVTKVANVGLPKYVKYGQKYPFILISPQLKTTMGRWTGAYVMEVLNYVKTYLRVDPNRIYLTGLSLGGGGVWSVATSYPTVWASILPICSGYNVISGASALANADVPVWGFHGDADGVVAESVTINMVNAINSYKPSPLAKVTIFPGLGHVIWDKVYKETSALSWLLSYTKGTTSTSPGNNAPIANAGSDKSLTLPSNSAVIYGSATDTDGSVTTYTWTKKSGSTVSMSGTTSKTLSASNMVAGTYVFTLTVKDDKGATDTDDVTVVVKSSTTTTTTTTTTNVAPVANAGADRIVVLPTTATAITGSGSDSDGSISSYAWSKVSGGSVYMTGTTASTLKLASLVAGTYTFRLTVKDNKGATDTDDIVVVVNNAPVVKAGADKSITLGYSSLTLTGSATDADGTIASYVWSKYSGPNLRMSNTTSTTVTLSGFYEGTYVIKLQAKDNRGTSGYDYVKVVVSGSTTSVDYISEDEAVRLASLDTSIPTGTI
jgi:hypothetical protein